MHDVWSVSYTHLLDIMIDEVKNFDMKVFLAFQRVAFSDGVMETMMEKGNLDELFEEEQE